MTLLFVTGPSGSGKSTLCSALGDMLGFRVVNVGDCLAAILRIECDLVPVTRDDIGPTFMREQGIHRYHEVLLEEGADRTILDGVRLISGVEVLRRSIASTVHVFREPDTASGPLAQHTWADFRSDADLVVPWKRSESEVLNEARRIARRDDSNT